jgi:hypothetical protein
MKKVVEELKEYYVKFTDEELAELNIQSGDKFSIHANEDGSILLKKYATIDIDLSDFSRDMLEFLIQESCNKDVSVNEVIEEVITKSIKNFE